MQFTPTKTVCRTGIHDHFRRGDPCDRSVQPEISRTDVELEGQSSSIQRVPFAEKALHEPLKVSVTLVCNLEGALRVHAVFE